MSHIHEDRGLNVKFRVYFSRLPHKYMNARMTVGLGISPVVGRLTLDQEALVRIQDPQPGSFGLSLI